MNTLPRLFYSVSDLGQARQNGSQMVFWQKDSYFQMDHLYHFNFSN